MDCKSARGAVVCVRGWPPARTHDAYLGGAAWRCRHWCPFRDEFCAAQCGCGTLERHRAQDTRWWRRRYCGAVVPYSRAAAGHVSATPFSLCSGVWVRGVVQAIVSGTERAVRTSCMGVRPLMHTCTLSRTQHNVCMCAWEGCFRPRVARACRTCV